MPDLPYIYSTEGKIKEPNLAAEAGSGLLSAVTSYARGDMVGTAYALSSRISCSSSHPAWSFLRAPCFRPCLAFSRPPQDRTRERRRKLGLQRQVRPMWYVSRLWSIRISCSCAAREDLLERMQGFTDQRRYLRGRSIYGRYELCGFLESQLIISD